MDPPTFADAPFPEIERRCSQRHAASYRTRVRLASNVFSDCRTRDIGHGGASLRSPDPFVSGSKVQMALRLPDTHRGGPCKLAMASATVVSSSRSGGQFRIRLQWVSSNTQALVALTAWLQSRRR